MHQYQHRIGHLYRTVSALSTWKLARITHLAPATYHIRTHLQPKHSLISQIPPKMDLVRYNFHWRPGQNTAASWRSERHTTALGELASKTRSTLGAQSAGYPEISTTRMGDGASEREEGAEVRRKELDVYLGNVTGVYEYSIEVDVVLLGD